MNSQQRMDRAHEIFAWLDGRADRVTEQRERDVAIQVARAANYRSERARRDA